jgi:ribosomal protein L11 methyltransferase
VEAARSQWQACAVGDRFFLVPEWSEAPAPPGRLRLAMRPGRACGTGWHAATQVALEAMERWVRPGSAVLDLGAGSGILSSAAALLGAGAIYACDIDFDAAAVARERLASEGVRAGVFAGSVRSVRGGALDAVVANINAEVVIDLEPEIRRALKPGGCAILAGFPERHLARVRRAWGPGLDTFEREGWIALVC